MKEEEERKKEENRILSRLEREATKNKSNRIRNLAHLRYVPLNK